MPTAQLPALRLLIVDDHAMLREGLEAMLRPALAPVEIATAASGAEALPLLAAFQPQIILLDVRLPGGDGFGILEGLQTGGPGARVLMLSASATPAEVKLARRMGAAGYLSKSADGAEVVQAIRNILHGGTSFAPDPAPPTAGQPGLSARELDVLRHLGRGLSNQELGRVLGISETTVKAHLRAVFIKLEVADRAEAVARGYQLGLLSIEGG
jgi:DNA-binding NarL/FixJ family response regulator